MAIFRGALQLFGQLGLYAIEQGPIDDGGLLTSKDLALEDRADLGSSERSSS